MVPTSAPIGGRRRRACVAPCEHRVPAKQGHWACADAPWSQCSSEQVRDDRECHLGLRVMMKRSSHVLMLSTITCASEISIPQTPPAMYSGASLSQLRTNRRIAPKYRLPALERGDETRIVLAWDAIAIRVTDFCRILMIYMQVDVGEEQPVTLWARLTQMMVDGRDPGVTLRAGLRAKDDQPHHNTPILTALRSEDHPASGGGLPARRIAELSLAECANTYCSCDRCC